MIIGAISFALLNKRSTQEKAKERKVKLLTYVLMVFGIYISIYFVPLLLYIITAFLIFIALREIMNAAGTAGKQPWIPLLVSGSILYAFAIFIKDTPREFLLFTYFIVVHFDGFSQVIGESFGRHQMIPRISASKTWEGFAGGALIAMIVGFIIYKFEEPDKTLIQVSIIIVSSFAGDILASYYKRKCGIKDYSHLIPGHGGVLDRFDSFFMAGAVFQVIKWIYSV